MEGQLMTVELWWGRWKPEQQEHIATFAYSDVAEAAAAAICEQYKTEVRVKIVDAPNGPFPDIVFRWEEKMVEGVVRSRVRPTD